MLAAVVLTGQSMPTFLSGILLILLFAVILGWLPASGADSWRSLVLPSIALGALSMSTFARMARIAVVDELGKDYVRAVRAKGVAIDPRSSLRHVLRNAAIPVVTVAALEIGNLLAGAVIVETVFAWPGIGQLADPVDPVARLPGRAGRRAARLLRLRRPEPPGRLPLRRGRPAHHRSCADDGAG